jgi:V-type H+-transporting ATPase subunit H
MCHQGYQRAGLLSTEQLALIKRIDRQPRAKIESILVTDAPTYAILYLNLLRNLVRVDTMQYVLVMIADALTGQSTYNSFYHRAEIFQDHDERVPLFTGASSSNPEFPYVPLLKCAHIPSIHQFFIY